MDRHIHDAVLHIITQGGWQLVNNTVATTDKNWYTTLILVTYPDGHQQQCRASVSHETVTDFIAAGHDARELDSLRIRIVDEDGNDFTNELNDFR